MNISTDSRGFQITSTHAQTQWTGIPCNCNGHTTLQVKSLRPETENKDYVCVEPPDMETPVYVSWKTADC